MKRLLLLALMGAVLLSAAAVLADDGFYVVAVGGGVGTKINSLPYNINAPGFYYVTGNLKSSANGIIVNANDVTIDLMGFSLSGNTGNSTGIYILSDKHNVEVRNGTLSNWLRGIYSDTTSRHRVINIRAEESFYGIVLNGYSHLIKGCTASNNSYGISLNGGGTIRSNVLNYNLSCGIDVTSYAIIADNTVSNSNICVALGGAGSIIGNTVIPENGQTGINLSGSSDNFVMLDQNTVSGVGATRFSGGSASYIKGINAGF
jgi:hypothetical protein